jgi:sugar transferase (PEP-CTERM/EpsH1 system associated)
MRIRIMHVVDHLGKGGLENGLVNLIEHLDQTRFEHVVYAVRSLGPNADYLASNGIQVTCQGKQDTDSAIQVGALGRAIRKVQPDIVHSRNWAAVEAVPAARCWFRRCAVVHSEHGLERDASAKEPWRRNCFRRLAYELADRVLSVSYQLRDLHARRTGFAADRISVIHNGVDGRRFFPDPAAREQIRQELGIADGEFCIGCVGNLLPIKDHMTVLKALEALSTDLRNWRLLIVGEGPERQALERSIGEHVGWKKRVCLMGTSTRVPELLKALDLYILPSIAEGISNSLLEAMSSGLPVIATATGGNPEVVVDGQSGLLFPVGDFRRLSEHILLLDKANELRKKLAQGARRRVQQEFSIDSMIMKYDDLYRSLGRKTGVPLRAAFGV